MEEHGTQGRRWHGSNATAEAQLKTPVAAKNCSRRGKEEGVTLCGKAKL